MEKQIYWIWFQLMFGIGTRRAELMDRYFESPAGLWAELEQGGAAAGMLTPREQECRGAALEEAKRLYRRTLAKGCQVLTPEDDGYPELLRHIYARPAALYVKGDLSCLKALSIAMVGTRTHSEYGERAARSLAGALAANGVTVVSGLARGIDTICHEAALAAGGSTVGVLGCGLDVDYPGGSGKLKTAMTKNGAVVSEYPLGTHPRPANFPVRNRVISGMARGVVVVEADLRSGSLITAGHALEQGRDVFAVPGDAFSHTKMQGGHQLIKEGAKLVECAEDILEEYGGAVRKNSPEPLHNPREHGTTIEEEPEHNPPNPPPDLTEAGAALLALLGGTPASVEELAERSGLEIPRLHTALTELELFGLVRSLPGRTFARCRVNA